MDIVLSICLQSNIPAGQMGKSGTMTKQSVPVHAPSVSEVSGSSKSRPMPSGSSYKQTGDRQSGKRRGLYHRSAAFS